MGGAYEKLIAELITEWILHPTWFLDVKLEMLNNGCVQGSPIGHQAHLPSATDGTIGNRWYQLTLMIFYRH